MVDNNAVTQNAEKDPSDWVTGDEPVTGPQQSYLSTLAQQALEAAGIDPARLDRARSRQRRGAPQQRSVGRHTGHPASAYPWLTW